MSSSVRGITWKKQAKLIPTDLGGSDAFGEAVFVHGNTVIVGANGHTHGGKRFTGAAYVFRAKREQVDTTSQTHGR